MKNIIIFAILILFSACKADMQLYDSDNRLQFVFKGAYFDSVTRHTFVYGPAEQTMDTVYLPIMTLGFVTDNDREYSFQQVEDKSVAPEFKAIAGVHFLPFDDPKVPGAGKYLIRAGENRDSIPIVVLRDASLKEKEIVLTLRIKANANFRVGVPRDIVKRLTITDKTVMPSKWSNVKYFLGDYGPEKHKFLIRVTNSRFDDAYIVYAQADYSYFTYLVGEWKTALAEENKKRLLNGLDVLREDPKPGEAIGAEVKFI